MPKFDLAPASHIDLRSYVPSTFIRSGLLLVSVLVSNQLIGVLLAHVVHDGFQTFMYRFSSGSHDSDHVAWTSPFAYPCRTINTQ
jgi:hypothetical protein